MIQLLLSILLFLLVLCVFSAGCACLILSVQRTNEQEENIFDD